MSYDDGEGRTLREFSTDFLNIHNICLALIIYDDSIVFKKKLPLIFEKFDFYEIKSDFSDCQKVKK